jgi:sec-independent protein translocase protein TatB
LFGIGGTELLIIVVVALLLFGPDKIPQFIKMAKQAVSLFNEAKSQVTDVVNTQILSPEERELLRDPLGTKQLRGSMERLMTPERTSLLSGESTAKGNDSTAPAHTTAGEKDAGTSENHRDAAVAPSASEPSEGSAESIWSSLSTDTAADDNNDGDDDEGRSA